MIKPYLNTETPHLDPKFSKEFHTVRSLSNKPPTPNGMGATRVYEAQFQMQESKIFAFPVSSAIIPLISQETNRSKEEKSP